jgi:hypothetical protein
MHGGECAYDLVVSTLKNLADPGVAARPFEAPQPGRSPRAISEVGCIRDAKRDRAFGHGRDDEVWHDRRVIDNKRTVLDLSGVVPAHRRRGGCKNDQHRHGERRDDPEPHLNPHWRPGN